MLLPSLLVVFSEKSDLGSVPLRASSHPPNPVAPRRALPGRGPSEAARSGSTGPVGLSFHPLSSWGLCEQEGWPGCPSSSSAAVHCASTVINAPSKLVRCLFFSKGSRNGPTAAVERAHSDRARSGSTATHAPSKLARRLFFCKGSRTGPTAAVERAHSDRARSGSTGPVRLPLLSFSSMHPHEQLPIERLGRKRV